MKHITTYMHEQLKTLYPPEEIRSIIRLVLESVCSLSYHQQILCKDKQIPENEKKQISEIIYRLKKMEPLQYILGKTEFYSIPLHVNPSVLIPRPETEELVDLIIKHQFSILNRHCEVPLFRNGKNRSNLFSILDVGTGSGCLAIALSKHIPNASVTAIDISEAALQTATENALLNKTSIRFIQADILNPKKTASFIPETFDLIVSNPPYIKEDEKASMNVNVLDYEPRLALFVPNEDPLCYYNAIADFAMQKLTPGGTLFFEINPQCVSLLIDLLHEKGFTQTEAIRDLSGKNRFMKVVFSSHF